MKSRSINKVILIGNLTRDPVLKMNDKGGKVCYLGLATNSYRTDEGGEKIEQAEFHNLIAFDKLAEIAGDLLKTGMMVYVEGELRTQIKYDVNNNKTYHTSVKLNEMILLNYNNKSNMEDNLLEDKE